jgi:hypothetical protein
MIKRFMPRGIKKAIFFLIAACLRLLPPKRIGSTFILSEPYTLSADFPTFFGYHDKTPFSADNLILLAVSTAACDTNPKSECSPMDIGYFLRSEEGGYKSTFFIFARTSLWCFQQGCMLQWHPIRSNSELYFNDLVDGQYGAIHFNIEKNIVIRKYHNPLYAIDPTGRYATTLNFSRLGRLRPGYGYGLLPDPTVGKEAPADDGLFLLDLKSGAVDLVVSLAALAESGGDLNSEHYVNHATFSPDGKRVVFFHLWSRERDPGSRGLRVCEVDVESRVWRVIEFERVVSHYCWRDSKCFLATTKDIEGNWQYTIYDIIANTRTDLHLPFNEDGHPMFHPTDKNIIVTDTYPDRRRDQHLCIVNLETKESIEIATLYSPMRYQGQVRCDLHPRWDREGRFVAVDSASNGKRSLVVVNIQD